MDAFLKIQTCDQLRSLQRRVDLELESRASLKHLPDDVILDYLCPLLDEDSRSSLLCALLGGSGASRGNNLLNAEYAVVRWSLRLRSLVSEVALFLDARNSCQGCNPARYPMYMFADSFGAKYLARFTSEGEAWVDTEELKRVARRLGFNPSVRLTIHPKSIGTLESIEPFRYWVMVGFLEGASTFPRFHESL